MHTYFLKNKDFKTDLDQVKNNLKRSDESRDNTFESWIVDLEDKDQPETCSIDDEDCEACGS